MALKSGSIKSVSAKSNPVNTAVSPVRPPASTPLALSAKDVVVDTPKTAPSALTPAST